MQVVAIQIQLSSSQGSTDGKAVLKAVPPATARHKGFLALFSCWALAFLTIPIPFVHFVAPPFLLILGPFVGFLVHRVYKGAIDITDGGAACPDCGKPVSLANRDAHWPLEVTCAACQTRLLARPTTVLEKAH